MWPLPEESRATAPEDSSKRQCSAGPLAGGASGTTATSGGGGAVSGVGAGVVSSLTTSTGAASTGWLSSGRLSAPAMSVGPGIDHLGGVQRAGIRHGFAIAGRRWGAVGG